MSKSGRSILIAVSVLGGIGLLAGGCSKAATPTATDAPATTTSAAVTTTSPPTTAVTTTTVAPTTTAPASPYPNGDIGDKDFAVQAIQEANDGLGDIGGTIRITNVGTQAYTVTFTVTFFANQNLSGQPLGSAEGSAESVAPGQTVTEPMTSEDPMFSQSTYYYQFQVDSEF
jgi:hypothetical protein